MITFYTIVKINIKFNIYDIYKLKKQMSYMSEVIIVKYIHRFYIAYVFF